MKLAGDLVIREAANEDIEGIIEVLETIYLQNVAWAERAIKKLLATENYVILVTELDDQVVGFIDYIFCPQSGKNGTRQLSTTFSSTKIIKARVWVLDCWKK